MILLDSGCLDEIYFKISLKDSTFFLLRSFLTPWRVYFFWLFLPFTNPVTLSDEKERIQGVVYVLTTLVSNIVTEYLKIYIYLRYVYYRCYIFPFSLPWKYRYSKDEKYTSPFYRNLTDVLQSIHLTTGSSMVTFI